MQLKIELTDKEYDLLQSQFINSGKDTLERYVKEFLLSKGASDDLEPNIKWSIEPFLLNK